MLHDLSTISWVSNPRWEPGADTPPGPVIPTDAPEPSEPESEATPVGAVAAEPAKAAALMPPPPPPVPAQNGSAAAPTEPKASDPKPCPSKPSEPKPPSPKPEEPKAKASESAGKGKGASKALPKWVLRHELTCLISGSCFSLQSWLVYHQLWIWLNSTYYIELYI